MKLSKVLALTLLFFASAGANSATIWKPTDLDVDVFEVPLYFVTLNGGTLSLFEDTDTGFSNPLLLIIDSVGVEQEATLVFSDEGSNVFTVEAYIGLILQDTITMTGPEFSLGVTWDSGSTYYLDTNRVTLNPEAFIVEFDDSAAAGENEGSVVALNVAPVPLPAAAWLFGSALMGLLVVARRKA